MLQGSPGMSADANPWFRLAGSALTVIILLYTYTHTSVPVGQVGNLQAM